MTLKETQKQVDEYMEQYKEGYWEPHELVTCLLEEVGDLAREINHIHGPKKKKSTEETKELSEEIGDVLFALCCLANSHKIDLDKAFKQTMDKYNARDKDRWEKK